MVSPYSILQIALVAALSLMISLNFKIPLDPKTYWLLWFVTWAVVIALASRRRSKSNLPIDQIIPVSGFALVSVFSLTKVLIQVYNFHPELQEKLDLDGITAISISCVLGIAFAVKELRKLF
ncbi:MAG: hypothetical protein NT070_01930 [Cyanobacteria bacterium]|nr:hypothetical protein [Cyanobacteriota bacterium]